MWKLIRRVIMLASLVGIVVCIAVLLWHNFVTLEAEAANLTGRRYSSQCVIDSKEPNEKGNHAEKVLAKDLELTNNNDSGQRKCICNQSSRTALPSGCSECVLWGNVTTTSGSEQPDFVEEGFIAESKNVTNLNSSSQLKSYADAAKVAGIEFWIFVRTDTTISPSINERVNDTGGQIVKYFRVCGQDTTENTAQTGLIVCVPLLAGTVLLEIRTRRTIPPLKPDRLRPTAIDNAEALFHRIKARSQTTTDKEDVRPDDTHRNK